MAQRPLSSLLEEIDAELQTPSAGAARPRPVAAVLADIDRELAAPETQPAAPPIVQSAPPVDRPEPSWMAGRSRSQFLGGGPPITAPPVEAPAEPPVSPTGAPSVSPGRFATAFFEPRQAAVQAAAQLQATPGDSLPGLAARGVTQGVMGTVEGATAVGSWMGLLPDDVRSFVSDVNKAATPEVAMVQVLDSPRETLGNPAWWAYQGGQAFGSMISLMGAGAAGRAGGSMVANALNVSDRIRKVLEVTGATGLSATLEGAIEGGLAYSEAINQGATPEQAGETAAKTLAANLPWIFTSELPLFNPQSQRRIVNGLIGMLAESTQEVGQQGITNLAAKTTYDPNRSITEGMVEAGIVGGMAGGGFGVLSSPARPDAGLPPSNAGTKPEVSPASPVGADMADMVARIDEVLQEAPPQPGGVPVVGPRPERFAPIDVSNVPGISEAVKPPVMSEVEHVKPPSQTGEKIGTGQPPMTIEEAEQRGRAGFAAGITASAQDPEFVARLGDGGPLIGLIDAWIRGFSAANAEAPVPGMTDLPTSKPDPAVTTPVTPAAEDVGSPIDKGEENSESLARPPAQVATPVTPTKPEAAPRVESTPERDLSPEGITRDTLEAISSDEEMGVTWDEDDGASYFPDGSRAVVCTNCADQIIKRLGRGQVYGWEQGTNPTSVVAGPEHGARVPEGQGHDFAVIDDRYLVDPWAKNVEMSSERAAFDLHDPADRAEVLRLYGDPETWLRRNDSGSGFSPGMPTPMQAGVESTEALPEAGNVPVSVPTENSGPLAGTPPVDVARPGTGGDVRGPRPVGGQQAAERPGGSDRGEPGLRPGGRTEPAGVAVSGRGDNAAPGGTDAGAAESGPARQNYRIQDDDLTDDGFGGAANRANANLAALKLLKDLETTGRAATPEEQKQLLRYTGWGASDLQSIFSNPRDAKRLRDVLDEDEFNAARKSTVAAHYTSKPVVKFVYDAVRRLGFTGGKVLEPAMGTGHFFGLMPEDIAKKSKLFGVELDKVTARIAAQLYPKATIQNKGIQDTKFSNDSFDLIIGNPPFGNFGVADPEFKRRPPGLSKSIHNYFFAKAIDKVRPGGVVAFVTSANTLNARTARDVRQHLAERADFLGAVRLPNTAFKRNAGTEVVTDVIFLRKRDGTETTAADQSWIDSTEVEIDGFKANVNAYFQTNPDMVLGRQAMTGSMYRQNEYTVEPTGDLAEQLAAAMAKLPENVYRDRAAQVQEPRVPTAEVEGGIVDDTQAPLSYFERDGVVYQKQFDGTVIRADFGDKVSLPRVKGLIGVRAALQDTIRTMLDPAASDAAVKKAQKQLEKTYDGFVKAHGPISSPAVVRTFSEDPSLPLLLSLEASYDKDTKTAEKAEIFTKRTLRPVARVESAESPKDALMVSLAESASIDWSRMSALTGQSPEALQEALWQSGDAFPVETDLSAWEARDEYLSGNVRKKLAAATDAAKADPRFNQNVAALELVQPEDLVPSQIGVTFGAPWIKPFYYGGFLSDLIGQDLGPSAVTYSKASARWFVRRGPDTFNATKKYGTDRKNAYELAQAALNHTPIAVYDTHADGTRTLNPEATAAAKEKADAIAEAFEKFIWSQPQDVVESIVRDYNHEFNSTVERKFDGSHLTLPGMSEAWRAKLRPHQRNAIWRIVSAGNTLLAHVVGAGKTAVMIGATMEMRRLGLARKPVIAVPNHLVEQWAGDFKRMYPNAKVFAPNAKMGEKAHRKRTVTRITTGDWDVVILPHSWLKKVPSSPEAYEQFIQQQLEELEIAIREAKEVEGKRSPSVKQLEKAKLRLETRLKELFNEDNKDTLGIYFEDLGIDALTVDEAHEFKNLYFPTVKTRIKGLSNSDSQRALDLFLKVRHVAGQQAGRNVVFATGTPISNTMGELFVMMKYLQEGGLSSMAMDKFDAWSNTFARIYDTMETGVDGRLKQVTRMGQFINLPELMTFWRQVADIQTQETLNLPRPKIKGGSPTIVKVPQSPRMAALMQQFVRRMDAIRKRAVKPEEDNALKVLGEGKKASLDMRLLFEDAELDPDGKLVSAADRIAEIYRRWDADKGTQIVFSDLGIPKSEKGKPSENARDESQTNFNVYDELRRLLVLRGLPANEVAFIHDANTDAKKIKLFDDVNAGRVRVLIGSTPKMGAGTNVQERLVAMHHLDAPWRPADLEQRDGRILRQGNTLYERDPKGFEVEIFQYVTEKSMDTVVWQLLEAKAGFIRQLMRGDVDVREIEDVDDVVLSYSQVKAAAAGDDRILEKATVDMKLAKLRRQARNHDQERVDKERAGRSAHVELEQSTAALKVAEDEHAQAKAIVAGLPEKFAVRFGNTTVEGHKDIGERLKAALVQVDDVDLGEVPIAHYGVPVVAQLHSYDGKQHMRLGLQVPWETARGTIIAFHGFEAAGLKDVDPVGLARRLENAVLGLSDSTAGEVTFYKNRITRAETNIAQASEPHPPFPKQAELDKLEARAKELEVALGMTFQQQAAEQSAVGEDEDEGTETRGTREMPIPVNQPPITMPKPLAQRPAAPPTGPPITPAEASPRGIVAAIRKAFNLPVSTGRFRERAYGIYKVEAKAIRTKDAEDVLTTLHELGHHLDDGGLVRIDHKDKRWRQELLDLGQRTSRPSYSLKAQREEGFAEFTRIYMMSPDEARDLAPEFFQQFERVVSQSKELRGKVDRVAALVRDYLSVPLAERGARKIDFEGKDQTFWSAVKEDPREALRVAKHQWIDDLAIVDTAVKEMRDGRPLADKHNAYVLARLARGAAAKAEAFLTVKVRGRNGQFISGSLADAIAPVKEHLEDFGKYLVALRALELNGRGLKSGITNAEAEEMLDAARKHKAFAQFREARDAVYAYQDAMLSYAEQFGAMSRKQLQQIRQLNQYYVPFKRLRDDLNDSAGRGRGLANRRLPVMRLRGSNRSIINPFESMVANTFAVVEAVEHNRAMAAFVNQADESAGSGKWIERLPAPQVPKMVNVLEAMRKVNPNIDDELGLAGFDPTAFDEVVTLFQQRDSPLAGERIITVLRDGKPSFYQVHRQDLYDVLTFAGPKVTSKLVEWASKPTELLRASATLTPGFIARNPGRDTLVAFLQSRHGFIPVVDTVRGLLSQMLNDQDAQLFWTSGIANSVLVGGDADRTRLRKAIRQMGETRGQQLKRLALHPIDLLRAISGAMEVASRLGEFKLALDAGGEQRGITRRLLEGKSKRRVDEEAITTATLAARDVTIDFQRAGELARDVNRFVAFFNAQVQGYALMAQAFKRDPNGVTLRLAALGLFSWALWWLNYDDEEYEAIPEWEKNTYWHVPIAGSFLKIPKPFEWGLLGANLVEAAMSYVQRTREGDAYAGEAFDRFRPERESLVAIVNALMPTTIAPLVEAAFNYDGWRDTYIVKPWEENVDSQLQVSDWTTETAKALGQVIPISPIKIDHIIFGYTAGFGRGIAKYGTDPLVQLLGLTPTKLPPPSRTVQQTPIVGTFVRDSESRGSSQVIQDFYEALDQVSSFERSARAFKDQGDMGNVARLQREAAGTRWFDRARQLKKGRAEMRDISSRIDKIYNAPPHVLTPAQKRERLDEVYEEMERIAAEALGKKGPTR